VSRIVPTGPQRAFEIKRDGFRFICMRNGKRVRDGRDLNSMPLSRCTSGSRITVLASLCLPR
jgi:hypothetical protein